MYSCIIVELLQLCTISDRKDRNLHDSWVKTIHVWMPVWLSYRQFTTVLIIFTDKLNQATQKVRTYKIRQRKRQKNSLDWSSFRCESFVIVPDGQLDPKTYDFIIHLMSELGIESIKCVHRSGWLWSVARQTSVYISRTRLWTLTGWFLPRLIQNSNAM